MTAERLSSDSDSRTDVIKKQKNERQAVAPSNPKESSKMSKKYKSAISRQVARQIARNRKKNLPRLNELKRCVGCMRCGKQIPPEYLDGHHVDQSKKFKSLAQLCNRRWPRVMREIFGVDRDQAGGGGPIEFLCQRYHEERHHLEDDAKTCPELEKEGYKEPWRIHTRNPKRNSH